MLCCVVAVVYFGKRENGCSIFRKECNQACTGMGRLDPHAMQFSPPEWHYYHKGWKLLKKKFTYGVLDLHASRG
jgi:hypothetical protein